MIRIDVIPRELKLYPQYYQDKYFVPNPNGRFVLWSEIVNKTDCKDCGYNRSCLDKYCPNCGKKLQEDK